MKLAAFDLEIADPIPEGKNWREARPRISCAALAKRDYDGEVQVSYWQGEPAMSQDECRFMREDLSRVVEQGYTLLGWNSTSFDLSLLSEQSGQVRECAELALNHVDLMFAVVCAKGHRLGLNRALIGMGFKGKKHEVTLKGGEVIAEMNGALAPKMWREGETEAVLTYLHDDVVELLKLAEKIEQVKALWWVSNSGNPQSIPLPSLPTVLECLTWPERIDPLVDRRESYNWIPSDMLTERKG